MTARTYQRADGPKRQLPRVRVWKVRTGPFAGMWATCLVGARSDHARVEFTQPSARRAGCDLLRRHTARQNSPEIRHVFVPAPVLTPDEHDRLKEARRV